MTPIRPDAALHRRGGAAPQADDAGAEAVPGGPPTRAAHGRRSRALPAMWRWWGSRPALAAAALYALLSVVFVGQGLAPGRTLSNSDMLWSMPPWAGAAPDGVRPAGANFEMADTTAVFHPFFSFAKEALPAVPLWNPHIMAGRPFLANAQSALFSPFTFPVYALPLWTALTVVAILKLFVASFGTYLFGRAMGMRFGGALVAGIVFAFGTFFVVWLAWPLTNVFSLLPWMLLLAELIVRRPGPLPFAGLAALVALAFYGGHPESTFHAVVVVIVFFTFRLLVAWRAGRHQDAFLRAAGTFALALAAGAAMSAALLAPLLELLVLSGDYAHRIARPAGHADARYLGALFLFDYWGRPTQTPLVADLVSNRGWYAGGLTLMLAVGGLVLRPAVTRVAFAVFALLVTAVVLGADPFFSAVTALPGFRTAHNGRMVIFVLFALAMLAGWGLDEITRARQRPAALRAAAASMAALVFCVPVAWMALNGTLWQGSLGAALEVAWGFADPPRAPPGTAPSADTARVVRLAALLQWLPLAGAGLAVMAVSLRRPRVLWRHAVPVAAVVGVAAAILVVDLFRANMGFNPAIPIEHAEQPTTAPIRYLQSRTPNRFAVLSRPGIDQPLQPDLAMRYGLYDARGYDYPIERRFDAFWRATAGATGGFLEPTQFAVPGPKAMHGLSLLSVSDLLQYPSGPLSRLPGLPVAHAGRDARVYRNPSALPRTFLVDRQRTVKGEDAALAAITDVRFDARRAAVTESRVPGLPQDDGSSTSSPGTARLVDYRAERVTATATANRRSLLVLTDVYYPGWKATVDGRPATIERVDYLLRGVVVPPGVHRVEFQYVPASWRAGWIVALLALAAVAATAVVGGGRRRPRR